MRNRNLTLSIFSVAAVLTAGLAVFVLSGIAGPGRIELSGGERVRDLSTDEVGVFADDDFTPQRRAYLERLRVYRSWPTAKWEGEAGEPDSDALTRAADAVLSLLREQHPDVARQMEAQAPGSVEALGPVLRRVLLGGSSADAGQYRQAIPFEDGLTLPDGRIRVINTVEDFGADVPELDESADAATLAAAFEELRRVHLDHGDNVWIGVATAPRSVDLTAQRGPPRKVLGTDESLDGTGLLHHVIFSVHPVFYTNQQADDPTGSAESLRTQLTLTVVTRGGDRYPIFLSMRWLGNGQRWVLDGLMSCASLRAAHAPVIAF